MNLVKTEEKLHTGPIDREQVDDTEQSCPECGSENFLYFPEQSGPCHSGLYRNHYKEHWWCEDCENIFVDTDSACDHKHYEFKQHGRLCTCGALMVDFGD